MDDPFRPSDLLAAIRAELGRQQDAVGGAGHAIAWLNRAADRLEAFERGAQQRALLEGLPLPADVVQRIAQLEQRSAELTARYDEVRQERDHFERCHDE